jgi:hypothetical protein
MRYGEDKGEHLMVDDDINVTSIVDREFAATTPKAHTFSLLSMLWDTQKLYGGNNDLTAKEVEFAIIYKDKWRANLTNIVMENATCRGACSSWLAPPYIFEDLVGLFLRLRDA